MIAPGRKAELLPGFLWCFSWRLLVAKFLLYLLSYNPDGTWFREEHGVDPDIAIPEDLTMMAEGKDPQLEKGIEEIKSLLKTKGYNPPLRPGFEKKAY